MYNCNLHSEQYDYFIFTLHTTYTNATGFAKSKHNDYYVKK